MTEVYYFGSDNFCPNFKQSTSPQGHKLRKVNFDLSERVLQQMLGDTHKRQSLKKIPDDQLVKFRFVQSGQKFVVVQDEKLEHTQKIPILLNTTKFGIFGVGESFVMAVTPDRERLFAWGDASYAKLGTAGEKTLTQPREIFNRRILPVLQQVLDVQIQERFSPEQGTTELKKSRGINAENLRGSIVRQQDLQRASLLPSLHEGATALNQQLTEELQQMVSNAQLSSQAEFAVITEADVALLAQNNINLNSLISSSKNNNANGVNIQYIACGRSHSYVRSNGVWIAFGHDQFGRMGRGGNSAQEDAVVQPTVINTLSMQHIPIIGISAGKSHCLAWDIRGGLYSWGEGVDGKLGHPIPPQQTVFNKIEGSPRVIEALRGEFVIEACACTSYSMALTQSGELYCWGKGSYSRLERDKLPSIIDAVHPRKFEFVEPRQANKSRISLERQDEQGKVKFVKISGRYQSYAAIDHLGRLWSWGDASEYCLGHDDLQDLIEPKIVQSLTHLRVLDVTVSDKFLVVVTVLRAFSESTQYHFHYFERFRQHLLREAARTAKLKIRELKKMDGSSLRQQFIESNPPHKRNHIRLLGRDFDEGHNAMYLSTDNAEDQLQQQNFEDLVSRKNTQHFALQRTSSVNEEQNSIMLQTPAVPIQSQKNLKLDLGESSSFAAAAHNNNNKGQQNQLNNKNNSNKSPKGARLVRNDSSYVQSPRRVSPEHAFSPSANLKGEYQEHMQLIFDSSNKPHAKNLGNEPTNKANISAQGANLDALLTDRNVDGSTMIRNTDRLDSDRGRQQLEASASAVMNILGDSQTKNDRQRALNKDFSLPVLSGLGTNHEAQLVPQRTALQLLEKFNKDDYVILPRLARLGELAAVEFDPVTDEIAEKERSNPLYRPIERGATTLSSIKKSERQLAPAAGATATGLGEYYEIEQDHANSFKKNGFKVYGEDAMSSALQGLIKSDNDLLKYEYIEIVKNGKEEDHLAYLLTNPEDRSYFSKERIRLLLNDITEEQLASRDLQAEVNKARQVSTIQVPDTRKVVREANRLFKKSRAVLGFNTMPIEKVHEMLERILRLNKHVLTPTNEQKVARLKEISKKRNQKIEMVQQIALENYQQRMQNILDDQKKRSKEFRDRKAIEREMTRFKNEQFQRLLTIQNVFAIAHLLQNVAREALEYKRRMFLRNMKARVVQKRYRKYLIVKHIINTMHAETRTFFRNCIFRFLVGRKTRLKKKASHRIISEILLMKFMRRFRACLYSYMARIRKLMLLTPPAELKQIYRREDNQYQEYLQQQHNTERKQQTMFIKDHLPFGSGQMIFMIAAKMPGAPAQPKFRIPKLNEKTFMDMFTKQYYEELQKEYNLLVVRTRQKTVVRKKKKQEK